MNIKKISIICPYSRTSSQLAALCARALEERGLAAEVLCFHPNHYTGRPGLRFLGSGEYWLAERMLLSRLRAAGPDLVLVIKGSELLPDTVKRIRDVCRAPVVNWWTDDPCLLGVSSRISPAYDVFFTNDPDSVPEHIKAGCRRAEFMTFACDPSLHRRVELDAAERARYGSDIVFVGLLTPRRVEFLVPLAGPGLKIWSCPVVQEYLPATDSVRRTPLTPDSPLYACVTGREAWDEELVKIYSASKVVINVHAHGRSDPNIRVFEATGCGAFLLTESRRVLGDLFSVGKELACFSSPGELAETAFRYLEAETERERIAASGQARAYKDHTYYVRMGDMLGRLRSTGARP